MPPNTVNVDRLTKWGNPRRPTKLEQAIRFGLAHWLGSGTFYRIGGMKVPSDIRDKVRRGERRNIDL